MSDIQIRESGMCFSCVGIKDAVKFDDTKFYRDKFNNLPGGKGVDIIFATEDELQLIEVKNCSGYEAENRWRTSTNNSKIASAPSSLDVSNRKSLDIEVSEKIAMTISCIMGAKTMQKHTDKSKELRFVWEAIESTKILTDKKRLKIVLLLEGDFRSASRSKKMVMQELQDSIKKKLCWLNCTVRVVDSATYKSRYCTVSVE